MHGPSWTNYISIPFGRFTCRLTCGFITDHEDFWSPHYYPPGGDGKEAADEVGGRPRRGAVAGVKTVRPACGLSRSTLTGSCLSPKSRTKYLGDLETTTNGTLYAGVSGCWWRWMEAAHLSAFSARALMSLWSSSVSCSRIAAGRRCRNSMANNLDLSSPGWTHSSSSNRSSEGRRSPRGSEEKSCSAFWKEVSWWAESSAAFKSV